MERTTAAHLAESDTVQDVLDTRLREVLTTAAQSEAVRDALRRVLIDLLTTDPAILAVLGETVGQLAEQQQTPPPAKHYRGAVLYASLGWTADDLKREVLAEERKRTGPAHFVNVADYDYYHDRLQQWSRNANDSDPSKGTSNKWPAVAIRFMEGDRKTNKFKSINGKKQRT